MINSKFYKLFSDEDACMNHFKALKGKHMACPDCGHQARSWQAYKKTIVLDFVEGVPNFTTHLPCKPFSDRLYWAVISF